MKSQLESTFLGLQIVHIVECCSGGTLSSVVTYIREQTILGAECTLVYLEREETPNVQQLKHLLPVNCVLKPLGKSSFKGLIKLIAFMIGEIGTKDSKRIYHLHSSWAGILGKSVLGINRRLRVFYTPHGYSFIRMDINHFQRLIFWLIEYLTNRISLVSTICTSDYEKQRALRVGAKQISVIRNAVDTDLLLQMRKKKVSKMMTNPKVGTLGRITRAKNPERFAQLSKLFGREFDLIWIGDGQRELFKSNSLESVQVTGWLNREEALKSLATLDIFILLSDWESFPFAVIEAQSMGIPCIVWNFPSSSELIDDSRNGFIVNSIEDAACKVTALISDSALANFISLQSVKSASNNYSLKRFRRNIVEEYSSNFTKSG